MSLVVSLRVPDGIVVASDSLSTANRLQEIGIENVPVECPNCGDKVTIEELKMPPIPIPFSASSYTQKLFSLYDRFALSSFGMGIINAKSIYYHINNFQRLHKNEPGTMEKLSELLIDYIEKELSAQFPNYKDEAPENFRPISFHLNGFFKKDDADEGVTYELFIGKNNVKKIREEIGCTIGGDMKVVQKFWDIGRENTRLQFKYNLFSLQDAIDFCEFLIESTCRFQRFANEVPSVGGEIDIALITPFHGFQWIKRKKLMDVLKKKEEAQ